MSCIDPRWRCGLLAALLAGCAAPERGTPPPTVMPPPGPAAPVQGVARVESHRSWDAVRLYAATRMVEANPNGSYTGEVVEPLLAIPVLEIELNADGSIRRIEVMRYPRQAQDTVQLAIDAVKRAAPFGSVAHLPKPWKFSEVFLFDEERRFKPRTLDR